MTEMPGASVKIKDGTLVQVNFNMRTDYQEFIDEFALVEADASEKGFLDTGIKLPYTPAPPGVAAVR